MVRYNNNHHHNNTNDNNVHLSIHAFISIIKMIVLALNLPLNNIAFSQRLKLSTFSPLLISTSRTVAAITINNDNSNGTVSLQTNNTNDATITTKLLANNLENRLQEAGAVLEITSKLPQVNNTPFAHLLNQTLTTLHGIPKDADTQKRQIAT